MKSVGEKYVVGDMVCLVSGMGRAPKDTHTSVLDLWFSSTCKSISLILLKRCRNKSVVYFFMWLLLYSLLAGLGCHDTGYY